MDLSQISTEDLKALQAGDLSKVSTEGLRALQGGASSEKPASYWMPKDPLGDLKTGLENFAGKNLVMGAVRGAAGIGATIVQPFQAMLDKPGANQATRAGIEGGIRETGADPNAYLYKVGKLGAEVAGTAGVGGALAAPVKLAARAAPALTPLANAIESAGFTTGQAVAPNALARAADLGVRSVGGAVAGAGSSGLIDPSTAPAGAVIGGLLPPGMKAAGALAGATVKPLAGAIARTVTGGQVAPEVKALADRAAQLGIDVPVDRIANSKPLNAIASSLNYVPFSGRPEVEARMTDQLNSALSRTFGQDSPNVTMALRKAQGDLGAKFEETLKSNTVKVDSQFMTDLADSANRATKELSPDQARIIHNQVDEIVAKAGSGEIDGQAAYNIKKTLDRIGERNSTEAFYARDLKKSLMGALDRSLGPDQAAAFAQTRKQYGNMLDLENLSQNGAEGGVSVGRLANLKNIGNPDLQELADIAAQFVKTRESNHGAAQRVGLAGGAAAAGFFGGGPLGAALAAGGTSAAGRGANALLDSAAMRRALLQGDTTNALERLTQIAAPSVYRGVPRAAARN